jgi:peptide chain release factor 3
MVIDAAKGIEARTRKLFEVCRLRDIPIVTFVNKMDREARDPFDLLDEIEKTLALDTTPRDLAHRQRPLLRRHLRPAPQPGPPPRRRRGTDAGQRPAQLRHRRDAAAGRGRDVAEEIALAQDACKPFAVEPFREGHLTPVFFGSALRNFGVRDLIDALADHAPPPRAQGADRRVVRPARTG